MAEEMQYSTIAAVKLLITSVDCDPKAELTFSDRHTLIRWNAIINALNLANYSLATRRLQAPPPRTAVAFLSLNASKKVCFLHSDDSERENRNHNQYEISYDDDLMNQLPSFCALKGLPRFHLFTKLPPDLQLSIILRLGGAEFACFNRQFRHLSLNRRFNIGEYLSPGMTAACPDEVLNFVDFQQLLRVAAPFLLIAAAAVPSFLFLE